MVVVIWVTLVEEWRETSTFDDSDAVVFLLRSRPMAKDRSLTVDPTFPVVRPSAMRVDVVRLLMVGSRYAYHTYGMFTN